MTAEERYRKHFGLKKALVIPDDASPSELIKLMEEHAAADKAELVTLNVELEILGQAFQNCKAELQVKIRAIANILGTDTTFENIILALTELKNGTAGKN